MIRRIRVELEADYPGFVELGRWVCWRARRATCPICEGEYYEPENSVDEDYRYCEHFRETTDDGYAVFAVDEPTDPLVETLWEIGVEAMRTSATERVTKEATK